MSDGPNRIFHFVRFIACTRASLIESGELINVSNHARDFEFIESFHITKNAWAAAVAWTEADTKQTGTRQNVMERLAYVLWNCRLVSERTKAQALIPFTVDVIPNVEWKPQTETVRLLLLRDIGDSDEPLLTVMLSDEI